MNTNIYGNFCYKTQSRCKFCVTNTHHRLLFEKFYCKRTYPKTHVASQREIITCSSTALVSGSIQSVALLKGRAVVCWLQQGVFHNKNVVCFHVAIEKRGLHEADYHKSTSANGPLTMKANKMRYFSYLFDKVFYMFRTCPLSIIRSISTLYTRNRYLSC